MFQEAATNVEFWAREFLEPALLYTRNHADAAPSWTLQQAAAPNAGKGTKRRHDEVGPEDPDTKRGGRYFMDRNGVGICRYYNTGKCSRNECQFAHACHLCRGAHPAKECQGQIKKVKGKGKNKKGKGKGRNETADTNH